MARPNLTVWTNRLVERLHFGPHGELASCDVVDARGRPVAQVEVGRELVLSTGSLGNVQILHRSGVGPAEFLEPVGIPVVHPLDGVGRNLQDHLQLRLVFRVSNTRTLNTLAASWLGRARIGLDYLLWRTGPLSAAPSQLGAFCHTDRILHDDRSPATQVNK